MQWKTKDANGRVPTSRPRWTMYVAPIAPFVVEAVRAANPNPSVRQFESASVSVGTGAPKA